MQRSSASARWRFAILLALLAACNNTTRSSAPPGSGSGPGSGPGSAAAWAVPDGWRSEVIPFPLDFAKDLAHTGVEELRFPKGFFDPTSPEYWSYAFTWRTEDAAVLDAAALGDELTRYFRGLIAAVDETKHQVRAPDQIVARAAVRGARFELTAHVFDAFGDGRAVDLAGWAERRACGTGALWVFVLAPAQTSIRAQLDELATAALTTCGRG